MDLDLVCWFSQQFITNNRMHQLTTNKMILMHINGAIAPEESAKLNTTLTLVYNPMVSYPLPTQRIISSELVYSCWLDAPTASVSLLIFSTFSMMDFLVWCQTEMVDEFLFVLHLFVRPQRITINDFFIVQFWVCFDFLDWFLCHFNQCDCVV